MFDRGLPWEVPIWHLLVAAEVDERRNHIRDVRCHEDVVVTLARLDAERVERARLGNGSEGRLSARGRATRRRRRGRISAATKRGRSPRARRGAVSFQRSYARCCPFASRVSADGDVDAAASTVVSSCVLSTDPDRDCRPTLRPTFRRHVRVDLPLYCQECRSRWNDPAERWLVYFTREEPPESSVYCPVCARREFGA
jgi:hypothetical protein